jgi:TRAP-type mannitol/chloroaromatic compound transport system substrate-binding protein
MDSHAIGRLEEGIGWLKKEVGEIKADVKALNEFKWRVAGGAALLSIMISLGVEIARILADS